MTLHGQALAGQPRLVEDPHRTHQHAVNRHHFGRLDDDLVSDADLLDRQILDRAIVPKTVRGLRRTLQQRGKFTLRSIRGVILQGLTTGEHQDDDQRSPILADDNRGNDRKHGEHVNARVATDQVPHHPDERSRGEEQRIAGHEPRHDVPRTCHAEDAGNERHQECREDKRVAAYRTDKEPHYSGLPRNEHFCQQGKAGLTGRFRLPSERRPSSRLEAIFGAPPWTVHEHR